MRLIYSFTLGPVVWIYISETVQQSFMAVSTAVNWMGIALITTLFPIINYHLGGNPAIIFGFFALSTLISGVINRVVLVETQGKKEYEINRDFNIKWK